MSQSTTNKWGKHLFWWAWKVNLTTNTLCIQRGCDQQGQLSYLFTSDSFQQQLVDGDVQRILLLAVKVYFTSEGIIIMFITGLCRSCRLHSTDSYFRFVASLRRNTHINPPPPPTTTTHPPNPQPSTPSLTDTPKNAFPVWTGSTLEGLQTIHANKEDTCQVDQLAQLQRAMIFQRPILKNNKGLIIKQTGSDSDAQWQEMTQGIFEWHFSVFVRIIHPNLCECSLRSVCVYACVCACVCVKWSEQVVWSAAH